MDIELVHRPVAFLVPNKLAAVLRRERKLYLAWGPRKKAMPKAMASLSPWMCAAIEDAKSGNYSSEGTRSESSSENDGSSSSSSDTSSSDSGSESSSSSSAHLVPAPRG